MLINRNRNKKIFRKIVFLSSVSSVDPAAREERVREEAEGKVRPGVLESLVREAPGVSDWVKHLDTVQIVGWSLSCVSSYSKHFPSNIDQSEAEPSHSHVSHRSPGLVGPTKT